ncbi:hypothetical protein [Chryseobacterium sp. ERMR1:04]|uniref:hypothetical protein n=1 Tax=Chryseobacterium sp. ERMR1:04 TaxID=1705393 RepID=UPI0006C836F1|nr:hypothetical protein [Chryseobacterium sp. ERMR1:04]KPH14786.1 hypothetical protein AMQ68_04930 [Chryseobacterium sp. ERMR1:04]
MVKKNKKYDFEYLVGKHKNFIVDELNVITNYYLCDIWTHDLEIGRFGREMMLYLFFEDDVVVKVHIKRLQKNHLST